MNPLLVGLLCAVGAVAVLAAGLWAALAVYARRAERQREFGAIRETVHQIRLREYEKAERGEEEPPTEYLRLPVDPESPRRRNP